MISLYDKRGVSAQKEEVHAATENIDKGLYPRAFCKIYKDVLGGNQDWINVMHADGAGTKSALAYLYWKETGDVSVWKGIAQDAIVMNLDDLICTGIYKNILYSSSIDRNKNKIPAEVLKAIIEGTQEFFDAMSGHGISISFLGGETADVGDIVRTIAVNGTMAARWPQNHLITNEKISPGNLIVGLASFGQAIYEREYNSGIGSNGLTSARHDLLDKIYKETNESYDESLDDDVVYIGKHMLGDIINVKHNGSLRPMSVGKLMLSPTRTFAPVLKTLLEEHFNSIKGLVHCSGGGQTKCLKYIPEGVRIIKDNLFDTPEIFNLIQESSGSDAREMYQVFNMGCRMEIYTDEKDVNKVIATANDFGIDARVIGRVESTPVKELIIRTGELEIVY